VKKLRGGLILISLILPILSAGGMNLLEEDLLDVSSKAQESGKYLYVAFLGDGWSVSSKRFKEGVLDTPEFKQFAEDRLLYCPVLARRTPKLSKDETAHLQSLVIHFDIKSYPTLILLAPDGTEVLRHGYREVSAEAYISLLKAVLPDDEEAGQSGD
jgi:thioredoxin-related protein